MKPTIVEKFACNGEHSHWSVIDVETGEVIIEDIMVNKNIKAEIRKIRDYTDEYHSYIVVITDGKSMPYLHIPETYPGDVLDMVMEKLNS